MVILPTKHFAYWSFHLRDISSTEQFTKAKLKVQFWQLQNVYCFLQTVNAFDCQNCTLNLVNFLFHIVYCLRSDESNQYVKRLTSNQSTICKEYLLIFHIIMAHVQSWLNWTFYWKLYILVCLAMLELAINFTGSPQQVC